jgi:hypothetical protein
VVEEAIPEPEPRAPEPTPEAEPEPEASPRELLRQAAENLVQLRKLAKAKHNTKLQEAYAARLHSLSQ